MAEIREKTVAISSPIRNAYIDFSKMTLSLVAVTTDVMRDGKPVIGYGFNSNGRYGQGTLMRERFIPRILEADPQALVNDAGDNLDPQLLRQANGNGRESVFDAGRPQPDSLWRNAPRQGLAAIRLRTQLRACRIPSHAGHASPARVVREPLYSSRWASDVAQYRRWSRTRRQSPIQICSSLMAVFPTE
jgi:hypothetical protein